MLYQTRSWNDNCETFYIDIREFPKHDGDAEDNVD